MIICIGREFGSGGHEIGKRIAENLHLSFYDNELLETASKQSNIEFEKLKKADEKKANSWLHTILYEADEKNLRGLSANDILFQVQSNMILKFAKEDNCVFVGRCSDNVLTKANISHISLFITAPFSDRVSRKMQLLSLDEKSTITLVRKTDKQRKAYYDFYTGGNWGKPYNYDICIKSSTLGLEGTVNSLSIILPKLEKKYMHRGEMNKRSNNNA